LTLPLETITSCYPEYAIPNSNHIPDGTVGDPQAWFALTLRRIAEGWPTSQIEKLMPWNYKI